QVLLALLLLTGFLARPARAAEEDQSQPYVVIVGIDNYPDAQIVPRKHAEADAQALYDVLTGKEYLGVDAKHIRLLLGKEDEKRHSQPATRANVLEDLKWVSENAKRDDLVIVAFLVQGAPLGERACFFATDSTFKNRKKDAI